MVGLLIALLAGIIASIENYHTPGPVTAKLSSGA